MENILEQTENLLKLRNYSPKTKKSYLLYIEQFLVFSRENEIRNKKEAIEKFLLEKIENKNSPQTVNLALNSVKFFYRDVLKDSEKIDLKFAKRSKKLPIVLSRNEIKKIIFSTENEKYKLMISLGYAGGLCVSEVVNLKTADLDVKELTMHIKDAKR